MSRNEEGNIMPAKLSELFDGLTLPESVAAGTVLKIVYTEPCLLYTSDAADEL